MFHLKVKRLHFGYICGVATDSHRNQYTSVGQIFRYLYKFKYIWMYILICHNNCWFFAGWIYLNNHFWSFYTHKYIQIFICPIAMMNILEFLLFSKMLKIVINNPKWFNLGNHPTKYENGQISPKQSWANILIFKYVLIFGQIYVFAKIFIHVF